MINFFKNKNNIICFILLFLIIFLIIIFIINNLNNNYSESVFSTDLSTTLSEAASTPFVKTIIVHITGCVKNNGIIEIPENSRIIDVINAANGITEDADISKINLAYIVRDAQKIYIPSIYDIETTSYISDECGNNVIIEDNLGGNNKMININSATQAELEQLPGIGESTALKILNYRKEHGNFNSLEDIKNVPGIGNAKYENIKDMICL